MQAEIVGVGINWIVVLCILCFLVEVFHLALYSSCYYE